MEDREGCIEDVKTKRGRQEYIECRSLNNQNTGESSKTFSGGWVCTGVYMGIRNAGVRSIRLGNLGYIVQY